MKILVLGPNSTKFYTHNLWATRWLEMQKLGADGECGAGVQGARCGDGIGGRCVVGCKGWGGMGWRVCSGVQGDAGVGWGGPGGVAPWPATGRRRRAFQLVFYKIK